jgi:mannose/fructose-specific phosphotransferase system component IIA
MSDQPLRGVIISHAALAEALAGAVTAITGIGDALAAVSNEGCDASELAQRVTDAVGEGPAILFVDLPGGSCLTGAVRLARGRSDLAVVAGVNLAMLLDFVFHRATSPQEAAQRAADAGGRAIRVAAA